MLPYLLVLTQHYTQATITGNAATFTITSAKLKALVATQLIAKLQGLKNKSAEDVKAGLGDLKDSDILSKQGQSSCAAWHSHMKGMAAQAERCSPTAACLRNKPQRSKGYPESQC